MAYSTEEIKSMLEPFASLWNTVPPRQFIFSVQQTVLNYLDDREDLSMEDRIKISVEITDWLVTKGEALNDGKSDDNRST